MLRVKLTLVASVVCLAIWVLTTFVRPVGLGVVHLFLTAGAVLLIRWYALRNERVVSGQ